MRFAIAAAALALLAACGQTPAEAPPPPTPAVSPYPAGPTGTYPPVNGMVAYVAGDLTIDPTRMTFGSGVVFDTEIVGTYLPSEKTAANGEPFDKVYVAFNNLSLDVRRITNATIPPGKTNLCGNDTPTYVTVAYNQAMTEVRLLVFTGPDQPGNTAVNTRACGGLVYGTVQETQSPGTAPTPAPAARAPAAPPAAAPPTP